MAFPIRRLAIPLAKLAVLSLVIWGGHRTIAAALVDLQHNGWQLNQLRPWWAVMAGVLYLISQIPSGWYWHGVLATLGQRVELFRALRAYFIGHLGKYVPGKAMVVVLRAGLIGQPHVKTSLAVVAVFYETFTTMACGTALATAYLVIAQPEKIWLIVGCVALIAVVGLPTCPPIFVRLLRFMRLMKTDVDDATPQIHLSAGLLLRGWIAISIGWVFAGASLWATLRAIGIENTNLFADLPLCTATVALAVALGFVSMLPAGFGVRDIALMQLLAPRLEQLVPEKGQLLALVATIVLRLIWLAAEVILAAIVFPLRQKPAANQMHTP